MNFRARKNVLYFVGDIFSVELLDLLKKDERINFIPVSLELLKEVNNILCILYTPSVGFKESCILEFLPSKIKKIAILDSFHFDFKDFEFSFKKFKPDIIFAPTPFLGIDSEFIVVPSFIQEIYSLRNKEFTLCSNRFDICFISQPLQEEREGQLKFNQHDLIGKLKTILLKNFPDKNLYIKMHPREDPKFHKDNQIFQGSPDDVLKFFHYIIGYNSAMLYAAKGLGKEVLCLSSLEDIKQASLLEFFLEKGNLPLANENERPSQLLIRRIMKL